MGLPRNSARGERGAAAVEFALVVPLLIALVFGIVDFGWAINRYSAVGNAAREGARVASLGATSAEVSSAVNAAMSGMGGGGTATVAVTCAKPTGVSCAYASAAPGDTAIVTISYRADWLTPMGSAFASKMSMSKESRMRIE